MKKCYTKTEIHFPFDYHFSALSSFDKNDQKFKKKFENVKKRHKIEVFVQPWITWFKIGDLQKYFKTVITKCYD